MVERLLRLALRALDRLVPPPGRDTGLPAEFFKHPPF
jgi:hypothetical protein